MRRGHFYAFYSISHASFSILSSYKLKIALSYFTSVRLSTHIFCIIFSVILFMDFDFSLSSIFELSRKKKKTDIFCVYFGSSINTWEILIFTRGRIVSKYSLTHSHQFNLNMPTVTMKLCKYSRNNIIINSNLFDERKKKKERTNWRMHDAPGPVLWALNRIE